MIRLTDFAKRFYRFFAKPRANYILAEIIGTMSRSKSVHILQVGANDGVLYDPIHKALLRHANVTATRIEPISEYFDELKSNCLKCATQVELLNICIADHDGTIEMYFPNPSLVSDCGDKGHGSISPEQVGRSREGWVSRKVNCKSFKSLIKEMRSPKADVYVSDCEGYDISLLRQLPIEELGIRVVFIELMHQAMSTKDVGNSLKEAIEVVVSNGFNRIVWDGNDFLSWQAPRESSSQYPEVEGFTNH
jgi:FkbM family methyltransferase